MRSHTSSTARLRAATPPPLTHANSVVGLVAELRVAKAACVGPRARAAAVAHARRGAVLPQKRASSSAVVA
eukprot:9565533-Alexandrium_andersonii.AAC.1